MAKLREISSILAEAAALPKPKEQIEFLKKNASLPLVVLLDYTVSPQIKFTLPEGEPPYEPSKYDEMTLHNQVKRLYMFIENHPINTAMLKKGKANLERKFVQLLEYININEAKLLIDVKDKKLPDGLTKATVNKFLQSLKWETRILE